jgi:hypothetical protein
MFLPGVAALVRGRVKAAWRRKDNDTAVKLAKRYVRFWPGDLLGWRLLCEALDKSATYAELEEVAKRGLIRYPGSEWLKYSLGLALEGQSRHGEDRSAETVDTYQSLIRDHPTSPLPYLGLAKMALHRRELDRVGALAQKAASLGATDDGEMIMHLIGIVMGVPSLRPWGKELMLRTADILPDEWGSQLMASVVLEEVDPPASERAIQLATHLWEGDPARLQEDRRFLRRLLRGDGPGEEPRPDGADGGPEE